MHRLVALLCLLLLVNTFRPFTTTHLLLIQLNLLLLMPTLQPSTIDTFQVADLLSLVPVVLLMVDPIILALVALAAALPSNSLLLVLLHPMLVAPILQTYVVYVMLQLIA